MLQLNKLKPLAKKRKRIGRGGSRGGTSTRGHKGQGARSGGSVGVVFEGGQMPLSRRLPKRGFSNAPFKMTYALVDLDYLNANFSEGTTVTKALLVEKGAVPKKSLVKILGDGTLEKKLNVEVDALSKTAKEAIVRRGGKVQLTREM